MSSASRANLDSLRTQIASIERIHARLRTVLPFHVPTIDEKLPGGGLAMGALHEIAGGANGAIDCTAPAAFAAGIAARTGGKVLWCHIQPDLFEPALARSGLRENQVVFCRVADESELLDSFLEALSHGGPTAVVAELSSLKPVDSQRLQFAAEKTSTMAIALRRWRRNVDARDFGNQTSAFTRWRVTELNSEPLPVRGVGRAKWQLELMHARSGRPADFEVEACNGQGLISIPSQLADGSTEAGDGFIRAVS
ncbi:protein ImuA [Asticcacaulis taihuensis]|uniref:Protein ImuA n=2 Tax=Asticcacaulis taihuensis TaxID=260084 RepID=A0A1G4PW00_9CAUL|nr:protein ImuA [Asticcacaulis taihuensis]